MFFPLGVSRLLHRLALRWKCRSGRAPEGVAIILTTGRTGSNLLRSFLNSMPGVALAPEVLNPAMRDGISWDDTDPADALDHVRLSVAASGPEVGGCKLMLYQLHELGISLEEVGAAFPDARFLVPYRESLVDQYVSLLRGRASGVWSQKRTRRETPPVRFDVEGFKEFAIGQRRQFRRISRSEALVGRALPVGYERLAADPRPAMERVCEFLGLEPRAVSTDLVKQRTRSIARSIDNHDEVADFLGAPEIETEYSLPAEHMAELYGTPPES